MCLGVPGRITKIEPNEIGMTMGTGNFSGISKTVCLAYVPDAEVGDYVVVHVGFALSKIDEQQAKEVFEMLAGTGELSELQIPQPDDPAPSGGGASA